MLLCPPVMDEKTPLAPWLHVALDICKSTDLLPRLLPLDEVPSGTCTSNAPSPLGTIAASWFVVPPLAVKLLVLAVSLGAAVLRADVNPTRLSDAGSVSPGCSSLIIPL